jgi:hypothetical protein
MIELFRSVFEEEMFSDVHYVDENPAEVRSISIHKKDGKLHTDETISTFNLSSLDDENPEYELLHNFFVKLNFQWHPEIVKIKRGLIARFFGIDVTTKIVQLLLDCDWVIVTPDVLDEIKKNDNFKPEDPCSTLGVVGTIHGTQIYLIPELILNTHGCENTIYTGYRNSITPVVHRKEMKYLFTFKNDPRIKKIYLK